MKLGLFLCLLVALTLTLSQCLQVASENDSLFLKQVVESSNKFSVDLYKIISSEGENCFFSPISIYLASVLTYIGAAGETAQEFIKCLHLPEKEEVLRGIRELLDQVKTISSEGENCFFSPVSIYIALALTYVGAAGETAKELIKCLHLPEKKEELLRGIRELLDQLKKPVLSTATEIFIEKSYKVKSEYAETAKKYLDSDSRLVDFQTGFAASEKLINDWVSSQTRGKINDLIPSGSLDAVTKLVLVNAIYFMDKWKEQFDPSCTDVRDFHVTKTETIRVPMMSQNECTKYLEKDNFKLLQIPYENEDFSMVILLPKEIDGLQSLESELPSLDLNALLDEAYFCRVMYSIPKFKVEKSVDLKEILAQLGLQQIFSDSANFTGIFEPTECQIKVDKAVHKAFILVNESGTEAAAATGN